MFAVVHLGWCQIGVNWLRDCSYLNTPIYGPRFPYNKCLYALPGTVALPSAAHEVSHRDDMPTTPPISTTTMCRKPPLVITSAAWLSDQAGAEMVL